MKHDKNYRKIYEEYYGPIPREPNGRAYEIHHKDGDRTNNVPENLLATTIQNHFDIHWEQGDYAACLRIAARMEKTPQELSELVRLNALKRVADGTNPLCGGENNRRRIENKTHNFLGGEISRKHSRRRVAEKTHNLLGGKQQRKMLADGKHPSQVARTCPRCQKEGHGPGMIRWHFDNCKKAA